MDNYSGNKEYNIYRDIRNRTNAEIYLGIVGPVRTGKSTFIKLKSAKAIRLLNHRSRATHLLQEVNLFCNALDL